MLAKLYNMKLRKFSHGKPLEINFSAFVSETGTCYEIPIYKITIMQNDVHFLNKFIYFVRIAFCSVKKHFAEGLLFFTLETKESLN